MRGVEQDLTGFVSGKLTVVRKLGSDGKGALWLCQCECGGTKITKSSSLTRKDGKSTKSCGCIGGGGKALDLTGMKFGRLTALRSLGRHYGKRRDHFWECSCECGHVKHVIGSDLANGKTQSCGCKVFDIMKELHKTHGMSYTKAYRKWKYETYAGKLSSEEAEDINLWISKQH